MEASCAATDAQSIEWLDFPSGEMRPDSERHVDWDQEWKHFNFLADDDPACGFRSKPPTIPG
jgi:hypothetical protein